jgi:hypothetical protein
MKEMLLDSCKEDSAKKEKKRINNNPLLKSATNRDYPPHPH